MAKGVIGWLFFKARILSEPFHPRHGRPRSD